MDSAQLSAGLQELLEPVEIKCIPPSFLETIKYAFKSDLDLSAYG